MYCLVYCQSFYFLIKGSFDVFLKKYIVIRIYLYFIVGDNYLKFIWKSLNGFEVLVVVYVLFLMVCFRQEYINGREYIFSKGISVVQYGSYRVFAMMGGFIWDFNQIFFLRGFGVFNKLFLEYKRVVLCNLCLDLFSYFFGIGVDFQYFMMVVSNVFKVMDFLVFLMGQYFCKGFLFGINDRIGDFFQ